MSRLDELRHIAGSVGIATRHVDALGVVHEPGEETLSRLIAAFGLPPDPQEGAELLAEEGRAAPFGLAPVRIVAQEEAAPARQLSLPAAAGGVWRDYLYMDGTAVPGFAEDAGAQSLAPRDAVLAARSAGLVDYAAVAALKRPVLEALYRRFRAKERGSAQGGAFRAFRAAG